MNLNEPEAVEKVVTQWLYFCPGFGDCTDFSISSVGDGMMEISWSSSSCNDFSITGIGSVYSSHGSARVAMPTSATDYTMSCHGCRYCSSTIRVYPVGDDEEIGSGEYDCQYEFYPYSFELIFNGDVNYSIYNNYTGNMEIIVLRIKKLIGSQYSWITDWIEIGELGMGLPAEEGGLYEMCFSNTACMEKENHYYSVKYTYNDVIMAPCSLEGYIVNKHKKE